MSYAAARRTPQTPLTSEHGAADRGSLLRSGEVLVNRRLVLDSSLVSPPIAAVWSEVINTNRLADLKAVLARWSWGGKSFGVSPVNGTSNPGSAATATRSLMAHLRGQLGWMPSNGERLVPRAIACHEQIDPLELRIKGKVALLSQSFLNQGSIMKISRIAIASLALVASAAQAAPEAVISFAAPTKYTDNTDIAPGTVISYRVLQGLKGAAKVKVADINGSPTTITTGLVAGNEYCFAVVAVVAGVESAPSNESCKLMPLPIPQAVVITVR